MFILIKSKISNWPHIETSSGLTALLNICLLAQVAELVIFEYFFIFLIIFKSSKMMSRGVLKPQRNRTKIPCRTDAGSYFGNLQVSTTFRSIYWYFDGYTTQQATQRQAIIRSVVINSPTLQIIWKAHNHSTNTRKGEHNESIRKRTIRIIFERKGESRWQSQRKAEDPRQSHGELQLRYLRTSTDTPLFTKRVYIKIECHMGWSNSYVSPLESWVFGL